ncbi:MAG TPA: hypothetical protein VHY22_04370 [Chthoniobacteraceae bacterium]|jgi:hypothetical protein|nr:hypothetical protein [Chthoniobacteraceae bacterium]
MRVFPRIAALAAVIFMAAGCAGIPDRRAVLEELNPAQMDARVFARAAGVYTGPIRATTLRGGFEGEMSMDVRLDLGGTVDAPEVLLRINRGISTAWAMYGERDGLYTNIPSKRYGAQGYVYVSTHAPNQMLLELRRFGASPNTSGWMILTLQPNDVLDAEWIGHSGWRGDGELWRTTALNHHW